MYNYFKFLKNKNIIKIVVLILFFIVGLTLSIFCFNYFYVFNSIENDFYNFKNNINTGSSNNSFLDYGYKFDINNMRQLSNIDGTNVRNKNKTGFFSNTFNDLKFKNRKFLPAIDGQSFIKDLFNITATKLKLLEQNLNYLKMDKGNYSENIKYTVNSFFYNNFIPKINHICDDFRNQVNNKNEKNKSYLDDFNQLFSNIDSLIKHSFVPISYEYYNHGSIANDDVSKFLSAKFFLENGQEIKIKHFITTLYNHSISYVLKTFLFQILISPSQLFKYYNDNHIFVFRYDFFSINTFLKKKDMKKYFSLFNTMYKYCGYFFMILSFFDGTNTITNNEMFNFYINYTNSNTTNINLIETSTNLNTIFFKKFIIPFISSNFSVKNNYVLNPNIFNNFRSFIVDNLNNKIENNIFRENINPLHFFSSSNVFGDFCNQISLLFNSENNNYLNEINIIFSFYNPNNNFSFLWIK